MIKMAFQRISSVKRFLSGEGTAIVMATIREDQDIVTVSQQAQQALEKLKSQSIATDFDLLSYGAALDVFNKTTKRDVRIFTPFAATLAALTLAWVFRYINRRALLTILALLLAVFALSFGPYFAPGLRTAFFTLSSLVLVAAICYSFRQLSNLYLPLFVVILAGVWTFGLLGLLKVPLNFLMVAVIPLLLGIGIDYPIYMLHRYEEERSKGKAGQEAMDIAIDRVGQAILLTTITTIAGFSSLIGVDSPPIQAFGMLSNFAMASSFLITMTLVPAVKALMREKPSHEGAEGAKGTSQYQYYENILSKILRRYASLIGGRRAALVIFLGTLLLSLLFLWQGHQLRLYTYDLRRMLPQDYPLVQLYNKINQEFRTYDEVQILLLGDIARLEVMRAMLKDIPMNLAASPYTRNVTSIAQYIDDIRNANPQVEKAFMERFVTEGPNAAYLWILDYIFSRPELKEKARAYIERSPDGKYTATVVRVSALKYHDYDGARMVVEDIAKRLAAVVPSLEGLSLAVYVTGSPYLAEISLKTLRESFFKSMGLSFLLCLGVMALALRSLVWGLVTVIPVGLVIGLELGTINILGLVLNASTAMVTAISIGLGVDYAIHLVQRFREERDLGLATSRTGEALFADFFTTVAAFFSLVLGNIIWNRDFGLLAGTTISYVFLVTILIFPALLALVPEQKVSRLTSWQVSRLKRSQELRTNPRGGAKR